MLFLPTQVGLLQCPSSLNTPSPRFSPNRYMRPCHAPLVHLLSGGTLPTSLPLPFTSTHAPLAHLLSGGTLPTSLPLPFTSTHAPLAHLLSGSTLPTSLPLPFTSTHAPLALFLSGGTLPTSLPLPFTSTHAPLVHLLSMQAKLLQCPSSLHNPGPLPNLQSSLAPQSETAAHLG